MNVSVACWHFPCLRIMPLLALVWGVLSAASVADEAGTDSSEKEAVAASTPAAQKPAEGKRIAVFIQGHPGDADHAKLYHSSMEKIRGGMITHYGFLSEDIHVFSGDGEVGDGETSDQDASAPQEPVTSGDGDAESSPVAAGLSEAEQVGSAGTPEVPGATAPSAASTAKSATRESLTAELLALKTSISADDSLFVIVMGHTHFENNLAWFNLPGPDLQQKEFAELFEGFQAKQQIFIITIPCSGYYIRTLSGPGRYVLSATEADLEINETLNPHAIGDLMSAAPEPDWDLDTDNKFSLFEFYIALCRGVADLYTDETLLATEHGLLDDNGDGRGTEIQAHYLNEEQGGLPKNRQRRKLSDGRDGMASSKLFLRDL